MTAGQYPVADPASFVAEPLQADEVAVTDPGQVAHVVNTYARVLVEHDLSAEVAKAADG